MRNAHVAWSFAGLAVPLGVAAAAVPLLLDRLGHERFGLLALAWGLIGYASVLDLGVGRALTHHIAVARGKSNGTAIPDLLVSALRVTWTTGTTALAIVVIAVLFGAKDFMAAGVVSVPEFRASLAILGLALLLQAVSASYRGVGEAYLRFRALGLLRMLLGLANFLGPLLVSFYTVSLQWLLAALLLSRALALWGYARVARASLAQDGFGRGRYCAAFGRQLLNFGGWFSVSAVASAVMLQSDRLLIGAERGARAVTAYVIPYEIVVQAIVLVSAVAAVVFPALSQELSRDASVARSLFRRWQKRALLAMGGTMVFLAWALPDLLGLWLDERLPVDSMHVARILCLGAFFNAVGVMYFSLLQAMGVSKAIGVLHLVELPLYLVLLTVLIPTAGIVGAALAWSLRAGVDAGALAWMAERRLRRSAAFQ